MSSSEVQIVSDKLDLILKVLEQHDKRFDRITEKIKEVKYDLQIDSRKLDEVYEKRDTVKIRFSKILFGSHAIATILISFFVTVFTIGLVA